MKVNPMPDLLTPEKFQHVNIFGDEWRPSAKSVTPLKRTRAEGPAKFHKGWRVVGVSIPAIEAAKEKREKDIKIATEHNAAVLAGIRSGERMQVPAPWNEAAWIASAPLRPVRSKPYEIPDAAQTCADLARKAGWLRVAVEEVKKGQE